MRAELVGMSSDAREKVISYVDKGYHELVDPNEWYEALQKRQSRFLLALSSAYRTYTGGAISVATPVVETFPANGFPAVKTFCNSSMTVVDNMLITKTPTLPK